MLGTSRPGASFGALAATLGKRQALGQNPAASIGIQLQHCSRKRRAEHARRETCLMCTEAFRSREEGYLRTDQQGVPCH